MAFVSRLGGPSFGPNGPNGPGGGKPVQSSEPRAFSASTPGDSVTISNFGTNRQSAPPVNPLQFNQDSQAQGTQQRAADLFNSPDFQVFKAIFNDPKQDGGLGLF